jgi:hypothetical protein
VRNGSLASQQSSTDTDHGQPPRVLNAGLHRVEFQDGEEFSKPTIADYALYKNLFAGRDKVAVKFFDCRVERVGPGEDGTIWVNLTDKGGKFSKVWFKALPAIRPQVLETALVAVQSNLICQIALTGTSDQSEIHRIHAIAK